MKTQRESRIAKTQRKQSKRRRRGPHLGIEAYFFCKLGILDKALCHLTFLLAVFIFLLGVFSVGVHQVNPVLQVFFRDPHVVVVSQGVFLVAAPRDRAASN